VSAALGTFALLVLSTWRSPTSDAEVAGAATYYRPGVMQEVARNRGLKAYDPPFLGGVALNRAGDLGRKVWLRWADGAVEGPFLVVDCAARGDYTKRLSQKRVAEVDAETARRRGFYGVGPVPVTVLFEPPVAGGPEPL
jgi:hypothetical protein